MSADVETDVKFIIGTSNCGNVTEISYVSYEVRDDDEESEDEEDAKFYDTDGPNVSASIVLKPKRSTVALVDFDQNSCWPALRKCRSNRWKAQNR
ncbi:hypothetical protein AAVH_07776 [Aphelenchoides avenae]|nr:hypothetical protein AAVH_07776 [Aphelenchus avenae]